MSAREKLAGFPPVFWINRDADAGRRAFMEGQFADFGLAAERIPATDGATTPIETFVAGTWPDYATGPRLANYAAHLTAMRRFLESADAPFACVMEDDCDLSPARLWPFDWAFAAARLPFDFDAVQLTVINTLCVQMRLHRRFANDYSTAGYLITRRHAEKLIALHDAGDGRWRFDHPYRPVLNAETMILDSANAFAVPLFLYQTRFASTLREGHVEAMHEPCRKAILAFWRDAAPGVADWEPFFAFEPLYGRLPPGWNERESRRGAGGGGEKPLSGDGGPKRPRREEPK